GGAVVRGHKQCNPARGHARNHPRHSVARSYTVSAQDIGKATAGIGQIAIANAPIGSLSADANQGRCVPRKVSISDRIGEADLAMVRPAQCGTYLLPSEARIGLPVGLTQHQWNPPLWLLHASEGDSQVRHQVSSL